MQGNIDSSFTTEQRDLFMSGLIGEIGVNAYAVWSAIKIYADFATGEAFPGMRAVGAKLGLSAATVKRAVDVLIAAKMLRIIHNHTKRRGQTYVARERLAVSVGQQVLCTIVIDYVPAKLRGQIHRIEQALSTGENDPAAFAEVEIIPGPGFVWDDAAGMLRGRVAAKELPSVSNEDESMRRIGEAVLSKFAPNLVAALPKK